jgi:hypothetical protein
VFENWSTSQIVGYLSWVARGASGANWRCRLALLIRSVRHAPGQHLVDQSRHEVLD